MQTQIFLCLVMSQISIFEGFGWNTTKRPLWINTVRYLHNYVTDKFQNTSINNIPWCLIWEGSNCLYEALVRGGDPNWWLTDVISPDFDSTEHFWGPQIDLIHRMLPPVAKGLPKSRNLSNRGMRVSAAQKLQSFGQPLAQLAPILGRFSTKIRNFGHPHVRIAIRWREDVLVIFTLNMGASEHRVKLKAKTCPKLAQNPICLAPNNIFVPRYNLKIPAALPATPRSRAA